MPSGPSDVRSVSSTESSTYTDSVNSTGTAVHVQPIGSHTGTDSDFLEEEDAWHEAFSSHDDPLDHEYNPRYAARPRGDSYGRSNSQPVPRRVRRPPVPGSEASSGGPPPGRRPIPRSGPASSAVSGDDGMGYPTYQQRHMPFAGRGGYPPQGPYGAYGQPPYGAPQAIVPFVQQQSAFGENPFQRQQQQHGYPFQGSPYGGPPGAFPNGNELAPFGAMSPYGQFHPQDPRFAGYSPYYPYPPPAEMAPSHPPTPAPAQAEPAAAPAPAPTPAPAPEPPKIDPETEKKLQEQQDNLAKQLKNLEDMKEKEAANIAKMAELQNFINESKAREQKMKDDAERAAEMARRIEEEVAKTKAEMVAAQKAKEIADAEAKFKAEVAAAAAAKAKAEKDAAEAAAKAAYEAQIKADADAAIAAEKAKVEAEAAKVKAEADAAVAAAKAEAEAAKAKVPAEKAKPIKFKDALGRKFNFPFELCKTWKGMNDLICQAFAHVEPIGQNVADGNYDLIGPSGEIILPQIWETVLEPDWTITMHMWPIKEKEPEPQGPPPEHPIHGHNRVRQAMGGGAKAPRRRDGPGPPPPPLHPGAPLSGLESMRALHLGGVEVVKQKKKKPQASSWSLFGPPKKSSKGKTKSTKKKTAEVLEDDYVVV